MTKPKSSIYSKAYHCPDGRDIHYAAARLRRDPNSPTSILDVDDDPDNASSKIIGACWIFFYPMGSNRRILDAVISRYAPQFECDKDVLFLCVNRPGKGGTSSSSGVAAKQHEKTAPDERQHIWTTCDDIVTILDHYGIRKASLLYMCAGSTFAYSFANLHPDYTTGYIIGIASWILRSDPSSSIICNNTENGDSQCDIKTPQMHSLTHRMAMHGFFGPKCMVSSLAGGIVGSMSVIFSSVPPAWVGKGFKKELSDDERLMFDELYPDGVGFVEMMKWMHDDGCDDEISVFVNGYDNTCSICNDANRGNKKEGDAKDVAVCLSTQQDLGLIYKNTVPAQRQVLLWHGESDKMIAMQGAGYLASMLPNATLTRVSRGTHQGTMFFFPDDAMEALNRISRDVSV
mmetsp:Transcript_43681/g.78392  ORF Transcript_43681/g.78392 Transcript_43681/m.78392 type:complete len:402 (+) Transcript_43681:327-1532(+)